MGLVVVITLLFVCPPGFLIGALGTVRYLLQSKVEEIPLPPDIINIAGYGLFSKKGKKGKKGGKEKKKGKGKK